jgi:SAM-dependent methyltransferase
LTGEVIHESRALTFGQVADDYDRWRPGYPEAAVGWLAPPAPGRVADVGAGTGKLTSLLLARGLTVEAVEPDPRMLAVLARNNPGARLHQSDSTAIPVEDRSLDAVVVADAWQWFDAEATTTELRRVLKPGGWLGLVWNIVAAPVEPWEVELAETRFERQRAAPERPFPYFPDDELEFAQFGWEWELTPEHRVATLATTSMVIAMTAEERKECLDAARARLQAACDATGRQAVPIRHEATCARWTPKESA